MRQLKRWVQSGKFPAMRIYLHAMFILLIISFESLFKTLYLKGYHFSFEYEYGPIALIFYLFYLCCVYCIAFIVVPWGSGLSRRLRIAFRIASIVCCFFLFIPLRYLVEQILEYRLFGQSNYPQSVTWSFYFHDNLGVSFSVLLAGAFLKFMDDWFVADRREVVLEPPKLCPGLQFLKSQGKHPLLFHK